MNTLELKGRMIEMITGIKNPKILQRLYHIIEEVIARMHYVWMASYQEPTYLVRIGFKMMVNMELLLRK